MKYTVHIESDNQHSFVRQNTIVISENIMRFMHNTFWIVIFKAAQENCWCTMYRSFEYFEYFEHFEHILFHFIPFPFEFSDYSENVTNMQIPLDAIQLRFSVRFSYCHSLNWTMSIVMEILIPRNLTATISQHLIHLWKELNWPKSSFENPKISSLCKFPGAWTNTINEVYWYHMLTKHWLKWW